MPTHKALTTRPAHAAHNSNIVILWQYRYTLVCDLAMFTFTLTLTTPLPMQACFVSILPCFDRSNRALSCVQLRNAHTRNALHILAKVT